MRSAVTFLMLWAAMNTAGCGSGTAGKQVQVEQAVPPAPQSPSDAKGEKQALAEALEPKIGAGSGETYYFSWNTSGSHTVYSFDDNVMGKGEAGFEAVLAKVSKLPPNSTLCIGPYREGAGEYPFDKKRLYALMVQRCISRIWPLKE